MSIFIDIIIIAIILFIIAISAKHGFVRTAVEVAGFVAAIIICIPLGNVISGFVYDNMIEPGIVDTAVKASAEEPQELLDKAWEALPGFIVDNCEKIGISKDVLSQKLEELDSDNMSLKLENAFRATVKPTFVKILGMLCTAILFIVFTFLVKAAAKMLNQLFSFSLVGSINKFLGGVIGIVKGGVFAMVFCVFISFLVSVTGGFMIFTPESLENSAVFNFLLSITPFSL